jgi:hypothetical protein
VINESKPFSEKDGKFSIFVEADRIRRTVGKSGDFQVGLCLRTKSEKTVKWSNATAVLPESVKTVSVPGPKPLSPTLQVINAAPAIDPTKFDPVALVRAVNHLQGLGNEKAIAELREFLKIARAGSSVERDPTNIDTSDSENVILIVRLLFEPDNAQTPRPELANHVIESPNENDKPLWPYYPLAIQDDFPFLLQSSRKAEFPGSFQFMEFMTDPPHVPAPSKAFVDWAEKHGKLRAKPLRPIDDSVAAADRLLALPQANRLPHFWSASPRMQCYYAISKLIMPNGTTLDLLKLDDNTKWAEIKKIASKAKTRWSEKEQRYIADN